jgi:hypothetical protein
MQEQADEAAADPDWPREAWRAIRGELLAHVQLLQQLGAHPRRVASEWASGERRLLNPLLAGLNALAVTTGARLLWRHLARLPDETPWWFDLAQPVLLFLVVFVSTLPAHLLLRLLGARRLFRTSFGILGLNYAGPMLVANLLFVPIQGQGGPAAWLIRNALLAIMLAYQGLVLAGAHRLSLWRVVLPLASIFVTATWMDGWVETLIARAQ